MSASVLHPDGLKRCPWPKQDPLYVAYHDEEWGVPEFDDRALFEKLMLDGFQAGLSWITILRKRDNFRRAFDDFEPEKIARYTPKKIERLMQDAGIVRNRAKIEGAVGSARAWLKIMESGPGFSELLWDHLDGKPKLNTFRSTKQVPAETEISRKMSKELARPRLQVRRADHRLCLHAGGRHGQRPSGDVPSPRRLRQTRQAANEQGAQHEQGCAGGAARLAAHAVGPPARSARPLAARRRDRGHRARACARRALERPDQGRAYLLGRPARAAGRGAGAGEGAAARSRTAASRCCCTMRRNT